MDFFLTAWVYRRCKDRNLNPLEPNGHYMYHQFNTHKFYVLPTQLHLCFVWISEQTAIIFLHSINWFVCITDGVCLLRGMDWVLGTESDQIRESQPSNALRAHKWLYAQVNALSFALVGLRAFIQNM
jgi:hypothetical protein